MLSELFMGQDTVLVKFPPLSVSSSYHFGYMHRSLHVLPLFSISDQVSGTSIEWYYEKLQPFIPFVYELRDEGEDGFLLPREQIVPTGNETLASLEAIFKKYKEYKK